jgi:hypothetical protein
MVVMNAVHKFILLCSLGHAGAMPPWHWLQNKMISPSWTSVSIHRKSERKPGLSSSKIWAILEQLVCKIRVECQSEGAAQKFVFAGLVHHIVAVQDSSRDLFKVALTHYTESFKRIQENSDLGLHCANMDLLYMALLNNMGHCRARLYDTTCMMISYEYLHIAYALTTQGQRWTKEEDDFFSIPHPSWHGPYAFPGRGGLVF